MGIGIGKVISDKYHLKEQMTQQFCHLLSLGSLLYNSPILFSFFHETQQKSLDTM